jgi:hypothetical protein
MQKGADSPIRSTPAYSRAAYPAGNHLRFMLGAWEMLNQQSSLDRERQGLEGQDYVSGGWRVSVYFG